MRKNYQLIFMGLLLALLSTTDAFAGRRVPISNFTGTEQTTLRNHIMDYLKLNQNTNAALLDRYPIVKEHGDNDAYIHNYNEVFLGWHRRFIEGMEAYVMPKLSSYLRNKCNNMLPYWDPTSTIPSAFRGSSAVLPGGFTAVTISDPYSNGTNYNVSRFTNNNFCTNYNNGNTVTSCADQTGSRTRPIDKFAADLECEHNKVHGAVGGVMQNSLASPASAIFWIWHAWVDEMYWDYELCNGKYASLPYSQNFNSGEVDIYTYIGSSNRFGRVQVTSANSPRSGSHLTMDSNTNTNFTTNQAIINLNLANTSNVSLSFYWKEWNDEYHNEDGIYFSDGGPFVKVFNLSGGNTTYKQETLNVSTLAANAGLSLTSTFKIKFQQYDNYTIASDGMAFDDISVTGDISNGQCNGFDSGWDGWVNMAGDDGDWLRQKGGTSSTNTGPSGAFTGDYYAYIEASTSGTSYPSKKAILRKRIESGDVNRVGFWYNMNGSNMGNLVLQVSNYATSGYSTIWTKSGDQGEDWGGIVLDIPYAYTNSGPTGYYLRFVGTTGGNWRSDMAIDNVCFYTSSGNSAPPQEDDIVLTEELELDMRGYPNPFSQSATIEYTLPEATKVVLTVRDITGREIKRLVNGISQEPGVHRAVFHAGNIPDGVYLYTLEAQGIQKTGKLILQR
ncbi:tyrosinase family protein [Ascidiimonas sp. W6]|uniref:tyrosinase family protein n=1 Tax=Ascidiimonas meishanensis TaxID=3128903 RepID=UPI0030EB8E99